MTPVSKIINKKLVRISKLVEIFMSFSAKSGVLKFETQNEKNIKLPH
jgi:hypothetical protein